MTDEEYKNMSVKEFTKAAKNYESDHAGIYKMCKKDYPDILEELEKEDFSDLLDAGCGPAPMISLLAEKYPEIIQEVRGTGLMLAVEFHTCELGYETAKGLFARRVMTAGTLVNAKTIRFEPTAVISEQDIKDVISRMDEALADTKKALNV